MRRKHRKTLIAIFRHPTAPSAKWGDVLALLEACGAEFEEREGSRIAVHLNDDDLTMHRPHPGNEIDKAAVASLRRFLARQGIKP